MDNLSGILDNKGTPLDTKTAKGFHKAKTQRDDHLIKVKTLLRRELITQLK